MTQTPSPVGASSAAGTPDAIEAIGAAESPGAIGAAESPGATGAAESPARPLVGIVMGSDSDYPVMKDAHEALAEFGIACEVDVVSAHRMPEDMIAWGKSAEERGIRVIIAGAGGAAHLPGMLASVTTLPVIGVPVPLKHLDGMDSLLSIVQMPGGVPVATVSVGGAKNAGLLAARILGAQDTDLGERMRERMRTYQQELREMAVNKGRALRGALKEPQAGNVGSDHD